MNFQIGFPIDAGCPDLSFIVITRLTIADSHSCTGGGTSGLRENGGAAYVFRRASTTIQHKYRYEFTPIPMPNSKIRPDNLCDVGYSDTGACALALAQYKIQQKATRNAPLLLISCAFVPHPPQQGLRNIVIEKVTPDNTNFGSRYIPTVMIF